MKAAFEEISPLNIYNVDSELADREEKMFEQVVGDIWDRIITQAPNKHTRFSNETAVSHSNPDSQSCENTVSIQNVLHSGLDKILLNQEDYDPCCLESAVRNAFNCTDKTLTVIPTSESNKEYLTAFLSLRFDQIQFFQFCDYIRDLILERADLKLSPINELSPAFNPFHLRTRKGLDALCDFFKKRTEVIETHFLPLGRSVS